MCTEKTSFFFKKKNMKRNIPLLSLVEAVIARPQMTSLQQQQLLLHHHLLFDGTYFGPGDSASAPWTSLRRWISTSDQLHHTGSGSLVATYSARPYQSLTQVSSVTYSLSGTYLYCHQALTQALSMLSGTYSYHHPALTQICTLDVLPDNFVN